jgi:cell fate regulator YaaT (PSP1 superfamily)
MLVGLGRSDFASKFRSERTTLQDHLVRIGVLGQIGRFQSGDFVQFGRGTQVVCRTSRGLEFGSVLTIVHNQTSALPRAGTIVRGATPEDHLLWARIKKNRSSAFKECQRLLDERAVGVALMDVELLFDGKSIYFYFLGDITPEMEALTLELTEAYESKVQLRQFAEAMTLGCGPDCGSEGGGGCGDAGCGSCSIAGACSTNNSAG